MRALFFTAKWCAGCRKMHPIIDKLRSEGVLKNVTEYDADKDTEVLDAWDIQMLPALLFVKDDSDEMINGFFGAQSYEDLKDGVESIEAREERRKESV